jgi:hypothetical protein
LAKKGDPSHFHLQHRDDDYDDDDDDDDDDLHARISTLQPTEKQEKTTLFATPLQREPNKHEL